MASGRLHAFWQYGPDAANLAAAALVAEESCTVVTTAGGAPWRVGADSFLAAAPALHPRLTTLLAEAERE